MKFFALLLSISPSALYAEEIVNANNNSTTNPEISSISNTGRFQLSSGPVTISYVYDALGRLIKVEDSMNADVVYEYDDAGNRDEVKEQ